jgi:hypothetical protein
MTKLNRHSALIASLLAVGHAGSLKAETMDHLTVKSTFKYRTQASVKFDIQLILPEPGVAGIVIYGESEQGLRLLQSRITKPDGSFTGSLILPAYLKEVKIQARCRASMQEVVLPIVQRTVVATVDLTLP